MSDREIHESCREWDDESMSRCGAPADVILWGKLFPQDALGPRCREHAENHLNHRTLEECLRQGWAIFDLRNLRRTK